MRLPALDSLPGVRRLPPPGGHLLIVPQVIGLALLSQLQELFLGGRQFLLLGALNLIKLGGFSILGILTFYALGCRKAENVAFTQVVATWFCVLVMVGVIKKPESGCPARVSFAKV